MWEYSKSEITGYYAVRCDGILIAWTFSEATARNLVETCNRASRQAKQATDVKQQLISDHDAAS